MGIERLVGVWGKQGWDVQKQRSCTGPGRARHTIGGAAQLFFCVRDCKCT